MKTSNPRASATEKTGILLVDDHPIVRQGLVRLIDQENDLVVCGEAESADEALQSLRHLKPGLVLVDLSLKGKPGLELVKDLRVQYPEMLVLVLSMHDEAIWAERAIRAGACGYVMKQEKPRDLIAKIRQALRGQLSLSEQMASKLLRRLANGQSSTTEARLEVLGDRELEVLQMIGEGMNTKDIATSLHISLKTVEAHREHIKQKLDLKSGAELLRYAVIRLLGES